MPNPFLNSDASLAPDDVLRAAGLELSAATQQLYPNSKTLIWVNKPNLFEDLREYAASHGIHDTFVDAATIKQLLATRRPQDRAIADRLMTESIMRTAKEISNRKDIGDIADNFAKAMSPRNSPDKAQEDIEKLIDAAGPQHPMYQSMREQYEEIAAKGNLKDPRLVSLRVNMAEIRKNGYN
jgi:murein L,D-transpeptidase YcbB/YkuD